MTPYRNHNRLQHRTCGGTFRQSTLADIGMALCPCGAIFTPDLSDLRDAPFIDPREVRERSRLCPECRAKEHVQ